MRFEELVYRVEGLPVAVPFHPKLTVVGPLSRRARTRWIERALGVLLGTRAGDGAGLVFVDGAARHARLERDRHGAARVIDVATGGEVAYDPGHLPLDGRFDWFATIGVEADAARRLFVLDASAFKRSDVEPWEIDDDLREWTDARQRVEDEYRDLVDRVRHAADLRQRLAALDEEIRTVAEEWRHRRQQEALAAVELLEAEMAGDGPVGAGGPAGTEWRRAQHALDAARHRFGDRTRLDATSLRQALTLPWVLLFDGQGAELWGRATALRAARARLTEVSTHRDGGGRHDDLVAELEAAHAVVERAEREAETARLPGLAGAARRRLAKALEREEAVLSRMGCSSWLAFQMARLDVFLEPGAAGTLRAAEAELDRAAAAWRDVAGDLDPDVALSVRHQIEEQAAALLSGGSVLPAGDDPISALVAQAHHGWLQRRLQDAEDALREAEAAARREAPRMSRGADEVEADLERARAAAAYYAGLTAAPVPGTEALRDERRRMAQELADAEAGLADAAGIKERRATVDRQLAALEAASRVGYHVCGQEEAEQVLLGRIARSRRLGPEEEPVPMVVNDALAGFCPTDKLALLHLLSSLDDAIQVVYLTEDPDTLEWAAEAARRGVASVVTGQTPTKVA